MEKEYKLGEQMEFDFTSSYRRNNPKESFATKIAKEMEEWSKRSLEDPRRSCEQNPLYLVRRAV